MAGDVLALVGPDLSGNDTLLVIKGDNEANQIRVIELAPGHARIEGINGTTINGKVADEVFSSGSVFGGAEVCLGNGADEISYEFTGNQQLHLTRIDTGYGDDSVDVFAQGVVGFLAIDTGFGSDQVTIDLAPNTVLLSGFSITTGLGNDSVLIRADSEGGLPHLFGFGSRIETEQGNDVVQFEGVLAGFGGGRLVTVLLGAGDDTLIGDPENTLSVFSVESLGGPGEDTVLNAAYFGPHFLIHDFETIL
jgi:hypothetical protein